MVGAITDIHEIRRNNGESVGDTIRRHLHDKHALSTAWDAELTLDDLSRAHAIYHYRLGRADPENDSATTLRQKQEIRAAHVTELGIRLPYWVYKHSYLSDLKTLDRLLRSAYLARPKSELKSAPEAIDKPHEG